MPSCEDIFQVRNAYSKNQGKSREFHFTLSAQLIGGRENVYPVFIVYQHTATPFWQVATEELLLLCGQELYLLAVWELSEAVVFWPYF